MRNEDFEFWSSLRTVSSFDPGNASTVNCNGDEEEVVQFSPSSLLVESLIGQLCKLIENDPVHQKQLYLKICKKLHQMKLIDESYDLEEFESMRSYYQKALYQLVTVARNTNKTDKNTVMKKQNNKICLKSDLLLDWSRYTTEYEEMDFIARGGFGQVFRARHKLDGELYAVKKIYLRYREKTGAGWFMQNLAEVKLLARLNHPNIVAYKAAWLEPVDPSKCRRHIFPHTDPWAMETSEKQDSSGGIVFESSEPGNTTSEEMDNNLAIVKKTKDNLTKEFWDHTPFSHSFQEWACLYIQMQLCEVTLRQWLDDRNLTIQPVKEAQCLALFKQIVQGVEYIHSQGIVHHDIKPSNIFVSGDLRQVQVGDFGLACSLLAHNPQVAVVPSPPSHHSLRGTRLYAAPEQLNGICTPKSDIYSLGIVLMELIQPFQTDMERSKVIGRLKAGHVPLELSSSFPTLVKVMTVCVYHSPNKRPSARELLELMESEDNSNFVRIMAEKDATIQRLNEEVLAKESEIAELKRLLSELSLPSSPDSYSPPVQFM